MAWHRTVVPICLQLPTNVPAKHWLPLRTIYTNKNDAISKQTEKNRFAFTAAFHSVRALDRSEQWRRRWRWWRRHILLIILLLTDFHQYFRCFFHVNLCCAHDDRYTDIRYMCLIVYINIYVSAVRQLKSFIVFFVALFQLKIDSLRRWIWYTNNRRVSMSTPKLWCDEKIWWTPRFVRRCSPFNSRCR